jgi:hypothetical protein
MALPFIIDQTAYDALSDVEKAHYNPATGESGKFALDCPGAVSKKAHDQFRDENIRLRQTVEAYGDIKPEVAKDLFAKKEEIEAAKGKVGDEVTKLVNQRVEAMKATHTAELEKLTKERDGFKTNLETRMIDGALIEAGTEFGLLGTAHDDLTARGRSMFRLAEDGKSVVAHDADGNPIYTETGEPMTPKAFVSGLTKKASHLFNPSQGAGSQGGGGGPKGGQGTTGNPWKKETFNLTQQSAIYREDPTRAKALAAQAGVTL